jgi:Ca-activated chloride channel family protein
VVAADQRAAARGDVSRAAPAPAEGRRVETTGAAAATANPSTPPGPSIMRKAQDRPTAQARRDYGGMYPDVRRPREPGNTEAYERIDENPFRPVSVAPLSTFSVDVDRASYSNVRRFLNQGTLPPKDAVRIEELVNYFPYGDATPARGDVPLRITTELAPAPWNTRHDLLRIALRAREVDMRRAPAANFVFLVDVSGSMRGPTRLPLVKQSLALLVNELREEDRVAIVVYAGAAGLALPSTSGSDKQRILAALEGLEAGGSTAGGAGIRLAYDVVRQHFVRGGNNRVILCTDGDFNVGQSSDGALVDLIEQRRTEGSFLTILGFGMGNLKDAKMEKLADAGNGNYGYIDDLLEARKMLVKEMGGTLVTVAKDVKLQVEFNPARVRAYRLLGYEDRLLRDEDFANDAKDAGEVGAGHPVTALYEIVRSDVPLDVPLPETTELRYQRPPVTDAPRDELLHVAMRYKDPDGDRSRLVTHPVSARRGYASESMRFASAVAGFGMLLRESPHSGSLSWQQVVDLARNSRGDDRDGYRADFIRLAELASELSQRIAATQPTPRE